MKNRTATNPINGNAINQVSSSGFLSGAHGSGEKAKGLSFNLGIAEPANIGPDATGLVHWRQCYGALWELKLAFEKEHNR